MLCQGKNDFKEKIMLKRETFIVKLIGKKYCDDYIVKDELLEILELALEKIDRSDVLVDSIEWTQEENMIPENTDSLVKKL